jgi:hypothetical protein
MKAMTVIELSKIRHLREKIIERCEHKEWKTETIKVMPVAKKLNNYQLLFQEKLHFEDELKIQPNWKKMVGEVPMRHSVNEELERSRRKGAGVVEVRDLLVVGDSGCGLFAVKK